jgi:uncharacterized protein (DUF2141 family)
MSSSFTRRLLMLIGSFTLASEALAIDLAIDLHGLKPRGGTVVVALYDQAAAFPKPESRLTFQTLVPTADTGQVVFRELPPGRYAVVAYQDANGNGKFDKNVLGIPTEAYGFSNDARGRMGPPTFEAAALDVSTNTRTPVTLR